MIIIKMNMITESEHYGATAVAVCNWCLLIVVGVTTVITPAITTGPHNITLINHIRRDGHVGQSMQYTAYLLLSGWVYFC